jgi:hypothetical protein
VCDKERIIFMARADSKRIIVLFCHTCGLPMPFEDYDESGIYYGKCAICGSEFEARRKLRVQDKYEIRPKAVN